MSVTCGPGQSALSTIAEFQIRRRAHLAADGRILAPLPQSAAEAKDLVPLYRDMVRFRSVDAKAVALQRTGRLGTYGVALGQEAVNIGAGQRHAR